MQTALAAAEEGEQGGGVHHKTWWPLKDAMGAAIPQCGLCGHRHGPLLGFRQLPGRRQAACRKVLHR